MSGPSCKHTGRWQKDYTPGGWHVYCTAFAAPTTTFRDDTMPTLTARRSKTKSASAERVKRLLTEIAYRLHTTRVVGVKPTPTAVR